MSRGRLGQRRGEGHRPPEPARSSQGARQARRREWRALPWLLPSLILIISVVFYPMVVMIRMAFSNISMSGKVKDFGTLRNFAELFSMPSLLPIILQTIVWVATVVVLTLLVSWPLALLLNQDFPGRTAVRYAIIFPWASSVVMTTMIVRWSFNMQYGAINTLLDRLGIPAINWLGEPDKAAVVLIGTAVFVSTPFSTYTLLSGLQAIPSDVYEAAAIDGAGPWQRFFRITRPMARSSEFVAVVLNTLGVFNSFPIIWLMTRGGPGRTTHTTITYMYELGFEARRLGAASALSIFNLLFLLVIVLIYLTVLARNRFDSEVV